MKYLILIFIIVLVSCNKVQWSEIDQNTFLHDCEDTGQSLDRCNCLLDCVMNNFSNYERASIEIIKNKSSENLTNCTVECN